MLFSHRVGKITISSPLPAQEGWLVNIWRVGKGKSNVLTQTVIRVPVFCADWDENRPWNTQREMKFGEREKQPRAASPPGNSCSLGIRLHSMATAFALRWKKSSNQLDPLLKWSPRISMFVWWQSEPAALYQSNQLQEALEPLRQQTEHPRMARPWGLWPFHPSSPRAPGAPMQRNGRGLLDPKVSRA